MRIQRILIASGDLSRAASLESNFRRFSRNCRVVIAGSGPGAMKWLREEAFDVILADCELPQTGGTDLALAAEHHAPEATVILMAGESEHHEERTTVARTANVRSVLTRPLGIAQLWSIAQTNGARS